MVRQKERFSRGRFRRSEIQAAERKGGPGRRGAVALEGRQQLLRRPRQRAGGQRVALLHRERAPHRDQVRRCACPRQRLAYVAGGIQGQAHLRSAGWEAPYRPGRYAYHRPASGRCVDKGGQRDFVRRLFLRDILSKGGGPMPFEMKPLACDPKRLRGLSEKLIVSHYENNYGGAVKRLNSIGSKLAELDYGSAPVFVVNGFKRGGLIAKNFMILHECYFDGLGGDGHLSRGDLYDRLAQDFGSLDRWRTEFTAVGKALGGGPGWGVLGLAD